MKKIKAFYACHECPFFTGSFIERLMESFMVEKLMRWNIVTGPQPGARGPEAAWHAWAWDILQKQGKNPLNFYSTAGGRQIDIYVPGPPPEIYEIKPQVDAHSVGKAVAQLLLYQEQTTPEASLFLALPEEEAHRLSPAIKKLLNDNAIGVFPL